MNQKIKKTAVIIFASAIAFVAGRMKLASDDTSVAESDKNMFRSRSASEFSEVRKGPFTVNEGERRSGLTAVEKLTRMRMIFNDPSNLKLVENWLSFVKQLGPDEFKETTETFRKYYTFGQRSNEYAILLSAWTKLAPRAAIAYTSEISSSTYREDVFARKVVLTTWAMSDPEAAISWAEANHNGEGENELMIAVISGIAEADPARATEMLEMESSNSKDTQNALAILQSQYLKQGSEAACEWAMNLKNNYLRKSAIAYIAGKLAQADPIAAFEWLLANPCNETEKPMKNVMEEITSKDPELANMYFDKIPDDATKSEALKGMINVITQSDPQKALAVINGNPSLVTDELLSNFSLYARYKAPDLVANIIGRILNEEERNNEYRFHIKDWLKRDTDAAVGWLNNNQDKFSEDFLSSMQSEIRKLQNPPRP